MYVVAQDPSKFARQLGVKPGLSVGLLNAPSEFAAALERAMPPGSLFILAGGAMLPITSILIMWPSDMKSLMAAINQRLKDVASVSAIWVVIPKKPAAEQRGSDLFFQGILDAVLPTGLVDNKTLTFSQDEYGIHFVPRKAK